MKFLMDCQFTLSKEVPASDIKSLLSKTDELLTKGAPPGEGAKIEKDRVEGDRIFLTISSGRYVRPHDAVFRLKNFFTQHLGKQYHAGVRGIHALRYAVEFELNVEPKKAFTIPFVKEISFSGKNLQNGPRKP